MQEICDRVGVIDRGRLLVESTVAELRGGSTLLRTRAEPLDRALAVRAVAGDDGACGRRRGAVDAPPAERPSWSARWSPRVDVHEVHHDERSLEEVFFEMTAGRARRQTR